MAVEPELWEWSFDVEGAVIDVLAEKTLVGDTVHLSDVAIYPRAVTAATVGAAAVLRVARNELPRLFDATAVRQIVVSGVRLSGANPGRRVEIRIPMSEEVER